MNDTFFTLTLAQDAPSVPGMPSAPATTGNGQTLEQAPNNAPAPQQNQPGGFGPIIWMILLMFIGLMIITSMSGRKQRKQREKMVSEIKRNDRVQTVGGVIGTVVELTDQEMTLRVDETSNTRIRFARSAVQQVLREGKGSGQIQTQSVT